MSKANNDVCPQISESVSKLCCAWPLLWKDDLISKRFVTTSTNLKLATLESMFKDDMVWPNATETDSVGCRWQNASKYSCHNVCAT